MKERSIKQKVNGRPAIDGAGVHLVRVLGHDTVYDFDPFLLLDSFDSLYPDDYTRGFPMHPHRGIETITYLVEGEIEHEDSIGNKGLISSGQSQWMTAGSGILHQEMPLASPRMLGLQFWLNLSAKEKMTAPKYFDITGNMIGIKSEPGALVRVIAGQYKEVNGIRSPHIPTTLYDVSLEAGASISLSTKEEETVFVFLLEGDGIVAGEQVSEKTAVLLVDGDAVTITAPSDNRTRFVFAMAKPLREPISWGGPIVMNTKEELQKTFAELKEGTFIK